MNTFKPNAWAKRTSRGLTALTAHALAGIRNMPAHGGSPAVSDIEIGRAITDAQVKVKVSDPISLETKNLDLISTNTTTSYGGYFRMAGPNPYAITVQVQRPGQGQVTEARFDYMAR